MKITTTNSGKVCTLTVEGRIDTLTAPEMEKEVMANIPVCDKMIFDYISSAGIRTIVFSHREMEKKNGLVLRGLNKSVDDVIAMTGFKKMLTIEA